MSSLVTNLPAKSPLNGTEEVYINDPAGPTDNKCTTSDIVRLASLFDPANYLASGGAVISWYAAQFLTGFSDGDPVGTLPTHAGIAGNATATLLLRPTYKVSQINSLPALLFDGSANVMASASVNNGVGTGNFWCGFICRADTQTGNHSIFDVGNGNEDFFQNAQSIREDGVFSSNTSSVAYFYTGRWCAIEMWRENGRGYFAVNGVMDTNCPAVTGSLTNNQPLYLGGSLGGGAGFFNGAIADWLFIRGQTNRSTLSRTWRAQYGL